MLLIANSIMTYSLAWYDYTKADSLTKGDKLKDKMQIDTMSFCILQIAYSHIIGICKLFSCSSKSIYAL